MSGTCWRPSGGPARTRTPHYLVPCGARSASLATLFLGTYATSGGAAAASWSNITLATCDESDLQQHFRVTNMGGAGTIVDSYTGRCITVWDCVDKEAANLVMAECGASQCPGGGSLSKESQQWKMQDSGSQARSVLSQPLSRCIDASQSRAADETPICMFSCGSDKSNQEWTVQGKLLRVGDGDYSPPCLAPPCCLKVECGDTVPISLGSCHPVGDWGWTFVLVLGLATTLYAFGGMYYGTAALAAWSMLCSFVASHPPRLL